MSADINTDSENQLNQVSAQTMIPQPIQDQLVELGFFYQPPNDNNIYNVI